MRIHVAAVALFVALGACTTQEGPEESPSSSGDASAQASAASRVVEQYTAAFNAHDVAAMRSLMADDIVWLSVVADSVAIEARGADDLAAGMAAYFEDFPDVTSAIEFGAEVGAFLHARETASWSQSGVRSSQSSLSTYEVRDGKVARVWYFPSG